MLLVSSQMHLVFALSVHLDLKIKICKERKMSLKLFCPKFSRAPLGLPAHGRPRVRVMDVPSRPHPHACFFSKFRGPARSFFSPGTSARMTLGRPQNVRPETFLFGLFFSFLNQGINSSTDCASQTSAVAFMCVNLILRNPLVTIRALTVTFDPPGQSHRQSCSGFSVDRV